MSVAAHRPATLADATRLFELRRKSILGLAPQGMSVAEAENWAAKLTVHGMEQKLRTMDVWVAEIDGRAVGWGATRGDKLEGLYTDPEVCRPRDRNWPAEPPRSTDESMCHSERACGRKLERRRVLSAPRLRAGRTAQGRRAIDRQTACVIGSRSDVLLRRVLACFDPLVA